MLAPLFGLGSAGMNRPLYGTFDSIHPPTYILKYLLLPPTKNLFRQGPGSVSSTKSFNSSIFKLGKGGGSSLGGGGGGGGYPGLSQPTRPAQGGVVIKMDFVRIEH